MLCWIFHLFKITLHIGWFMWRSIQGDAYNSFFSLISSISDALYKQRTLAKYFYRMGKISRNGKVCEEKQSEMLITGILGYLQDASAYINTTKILWVQFLFLILIHLLGTDLLLVLQKATLCHSIHENGLQNTNYKMLQRMCSSSISVVKMIRYYDVLLL